MAPPRFLDDSQSTLTELDLNDYEEKQYHKPPVEPLKKSEVWAWYIQNATYCGYGWVAASLLVPFLIQDMASKAGVEASDHSIPCDTTVANFKWAILSPLGWAFFNICGVFSHSYLPLYGRAHPDVLAAEARGEPLAVQRKVEEQKINDLSSISTVIANIGSLLINVVCIGISLSMNENSLSLEIAIAFTGVWWLMWILIVSPWLDARPNEPLPKGTNWVLYSWKKTYKTIASFRKLPEISKFMVAWFILSDGINTIPAILFIILYRELSFTHVHSLIIAVLLSIMASIGAYIFMVIRKIWALSTKFMILLCLAFYVLLMAYLVIVPYFTDNFGLRVVWEGWACTVYIGLIISTFYSSMRVMLSELCPEGDENEWFSLYLLADKGSSWLGPLVTGVIYSATNNYRRAFWFPLGLIVLGVWVLLRVDVNLGKDQAREFVKDKQKSLGVMKR
ncbi:hypothetical protein BGZ50_003123 [Haplosporangium sp. Z 11]|nr:hypothetical protein BGZ50_003123 [Haplosporangium sp. Z 11]